MLITLNENEQIDAKYLIREKLGEGAMYVVYRALDKEFNRDVAVKILKSSTTLSYLECVIKFRKEVEVISKLNHPNIIKFYNTGYYQNILYLVTELLEGDSLSGLLKKGIKFSIDESVAIIGQIAEALSCVHCNDIIHRDLKPGNIFVVNGKANKPKIKLLDFGLAHAMELSHFEKEKEISGTFAYMSPEAAGIIKKPLDERSDLYSVGVVFYYLLTGELPYQSTTIGKLLHQIAALKAIPVRRLNPDIPNVIEYIVDKLLEKDQDARYQSAKGLLYDLEKYLKGERDFIIGERDQNKIRLTYQTKLVGREEELNLIKGLINKATLKQGSICLIGGEPGVGKTKLVKAIKEYVYMRGYKRGEIFIESHCISKENKTPYQSFKNALDEYIRKIKRAGEGKKTKEIKRIKKLAGELGAILIKLNPNIKELLGEVSELAALNTEKENLRFIITISHFICNLVRDNQVCILFLDDLQWADEGSLHLLEQIGSIIDKSNLLILGTYRDNEINERHGLTRIKKEAKKKGYSLTDIKIKPLTHDKLNKIVANLLKEKPELTLELSNYISNKSGGNPFFTITLLKEMVEQNVIVWEEGLWRTNWEKINKLQVPNNIIDMILLRIKGISEDIEHLLRICAVIGKEFKIDLLYDLINKDNEMIISLVDQAVNMQFLEYSLTERGKAQFVHDRIKDAFFSKISAIEYRGYHLKIGQLLRQKYKGGEEEAIFELAHHFIEGGDKDRSLEYGLKAAEKAKVNYANQEAIKYYTYVKKILIDRGDKSEKYIKLLENLGEVYRLVGKFEESLEMLKACEAHIPQKNLMYRAQVLSKIGDTLVAKGELENSFRILEQTLRLLGIKVPQSKIEVNLGLLRELGLQMLHTWFPKIFLSKMYKGNSINIVALLVLNRLTKSYYFKDMKKSLYYHLKSLNLAEKIGPCSELSLCYVIGGPMWASIPWISRALRDLKLGLNIAKVIGDKYHEGAAYTYFGFVLYMANKPKEGLEYSRKGIHLLKGLGEYWDLGVAYAFSVHNCLIIGRLKEALIVSEEFIVLAKEAKALQNFGWALFEKGKTLSLIGDVDDLIIKEIKESTILMKETRDKPNLLFSLSILAFAYLRREIYFNSIQTIEEALSLFPTHYNKSSWTLDLFPLGAQIYLSSIINIPDLTNKKKQEYLKKAHWFCKKSLKWGKKFKYISGWAYQVNGTYHWLIGRRKEAINIWDKGIKFLREQTEDKYRLGYILMEEASFLINDRDSRNREKASKYLLEAKDLFKDIGAKLDYKKALELLGVKEDLAVELTQKEKLTSRKDLFHKREETSKERLKSERKVMTALETSRYLSSILDIEELLEKIMDKAIEVLGAERGILFIYPENGKRQKELEIKVLKNIERVEIEKEEFLTSRSIINKVEKEKEALIIEDAIADNELKDQISVANYGLRSVLCVPIKHRNELIGVIYLDNRMISGLFNQDDLWILELISSQAGVSIENARLFKKSVIDGLTGIYNRAFFDNYLLQNVERAQRYKKRLSLMLIDVDQFKRFNDTYGHQAGDMVLKSVAQEIIKRLRKSDVATRYGGDEFAVILPETGKEDAKIVGEEINRSIREHKVIYESIRGNEVLNITVSVGIAELEGDRMELIENADRALYKVKELGRNCVVVWK